jgi:hypothetical protein
MLDYATAGDSTIPVQNVNGPSAQWAIQMGKTGVDKAEIALLTNAAPSGTTYLISGTLKYEHPQDEPVYAIKYNQIVWSRSITGTAGAAVAFATSNIEPDEEFTMYDDTSGASTYAYKAQYYNSAIGTASTASDWITAAGYDFYSLAAIRQRIKNKLFSTGFIGDDSVIDDWINEYYEMMTNTIIDVNEDYNLGSTNVSFSGTAELGTITDADFKQIRRVWFTSDGVNYYTAEKMTSIDVRANQIFNETMPYYYMLGNNVISRWPHELPGTASILYYKLNSILVNETDLLPTPMRGYTKGFVDYCLAQAKQKDGKKDEAQRLENQAFARLDKFKTESTPRNKSGPTNISLVETVSDDATDIWFRA